MLLTEGWDCPSGRSSHEERGLKLRVDGQAVLAAGRSSHEERGLKYHNGKFRQLAAKSLLA